MMKPSVARSMASRPSFRTVLQVLVLVLALVVLALPARAAEWWFANVDITATINADGSMSIVERRTYVFSGSFSLATYTLARQGWTGISDVSVADEGGAYTSNPSEAPGTFQILMEPEKVTVEWFFRAADQQKTFVISYRVSGVVRRYRDIAELYWKFIGTGWGVRSDRVLITVEIPGVKKDELRVWGHGPDHGSVHLEDGLVRLNVAPLPASTEVEGRILFPTRLVPGAPVVDEEALPRILAEEE